jgi:molybdate/tungstate transport system ATP-binding protein
MIGAESVSAAVGSFRLQDLTFAVPEGSYGVVIGPAGSGKTTLLETIGGIVPMTGGVLRLSGRDVSSLAPESRGVGLVYQHGYLFPHLSVEQNITYGASDRVGARRIAERLGADAFWTRDVGKLSGGERQLVALARALARQPTVLLLDEPFSALDPRRRAEVRREVRAMHRERGLTVLQVTHDFTEAGLLGDVAVMLDAGRIVQTGSPDELFRAPASPRVAEFLGAENVIAGTVTPLFGEDLYEGRPRQAGRDSRAEVQGYYRSFEFRITGTDLALLAVGEAEPGPGYAVVRAEEVVLSSEEPNSSARNTFRGRVVEIATMGGLTRVTVNIGGQLLVAALTTHSVREMGLASGVETYASFKAMAVHLC